MNTEYPIKVHLEAIVMENGQVFHKGICLGLIGEKQRALLDSENQEACRRAEGGEIMVAIGACPTRFDFDDDNCA